MLMQPKTEVLHLDSEAAPESKWSGKACKHRQNLLQQQQQQQQAVPNQHCGLGPALQWEPEPRQALAPNLTEIALVLCYYLSEADHVPASTASQNVFCAALEKAMRISQRVFCTGLGRAMRAQTR